MRGVFMALVVALWPVHAPGAVLEGAARVIDGDTLEVSGTRIRLHGIDAPERNAACRQRDEDCFVAANARMQALVAGQVLRCRDLGERTHGRVVAQCLVAGQDIAAALLREGMVMACPRYALRHEHSRGYIDIEMQARTEARGLFASGAEPPRAGFCQTRTQVSVADTQTHTPPAAGACLIKGNISGNGRIYHMPGQRDYARTRIDPARGERWFCSESEARAAGWRPALR
jgi:endonuclease YncB( thermonuclease family)